MISVPGEICGDKVLSLTDISLSTTATEESHKFS